MAVKSDDYKDSAQELPKAPQIPKIIEIKMIAKECYKAAMAPYSEVPKELLALAKRKK